jgi:hypothetical protein
MFCIIQGKHKAVLICGYRVENLFLVGVRLPVDGVRWAALHSTQRPLPGAVKEMARQMP